ncbi:TetR/AcrR family transcriptional regulator [Gordonia liuliyuniae]|uniref:TetR/AcrR family transcriptional regulator n=1 Tax=Gordonia liuliyuniae TaxID=2911517 RepID=A0ABS9ITF2_9ACTN|nr:TetR/AcrR family transcriptional regulator [Gordonia liuliyuniae]MCF8588845.1 TetR/AcrR family transcriptional regulator [Gordonia liuliyuniae]
MATTSNISGSTRDRIVEIATELFLTRGYVESPLSAIAAEAGITKASLYYHFPSKDSLLMAIVEPLLQRIDAFLAETPARYDEFEDRWRFVMTYGALLQSDRRVITLLSKRSWELDDNGLDERFRQHIERAIELATPPGADAETRVRVMLGMDILQREFTYAHGRIPLADVDDQSRQEIAVDVIRGLLQS